MASLVLATVYQFPDAAKARLADYRPMIDLWYRHLRGPGAFDGDVKLITNVPELATDGIGSIAFPGSCSDVVDLFSRRILNLEELGFTGYSRILHLDLDILAVGPIGRLFACGRNLRVARSQMGLVHSRHAGYRMTACKRRVAQWLTPMGWTRGVNCCAIGFEVESRLHSLRPWCDTIREFGSVEPRPPLGDQTLLNLAIYLGRCRVEPYSQEWVQHSNWRRTKNAILWHFPAADRLEVMKSLALV